MTYGRAERPQSLSGVLKVNSVLACDRKIVNLNLALWVPMQFPESQFYPNPTIKESVAHG